MSLRCLRVRYVIELKGLPVKALRFHAARDIRVEDIPAPQTPRSDEVRVRITCCGICGTDLHEYTSGPIFVPTEPHAYSGSCAPQILGHEFGGVIEAVGDTVTNVKPGDRVSVLPHVMPRDKGYYAERGLFSLSDNLAMVGLSWPWGGLAERAMLRYDNVYRIPDSMSDEEAALVEPTAVCVYACERGGVRTGSTVLITGAGPIGALSMLAARAAGASRIFISDVNETRLRLASEILPDAITINARTENVADRVRAGTIENVGVDVAIEAVGNELALANCVDAVHRQGTVVQVGLHTGHSRLDWFSVVFKDIDIRGSWTFPNTYWPRVIDLIASGILPAKKIVTKRIRLDDVVREGFDALLDPAGGHLKILISTV